MTSRTMRELSVSDGADFVRPGVCVGSIVLYVADDQGATERLAVVRGVDAKGALRLSVLRVSASDQDVVALWSDGKRRGRATRRKGWQVK